MVEYFGDRSGKQCGESANPAEYMLEVIADPPLGDQSDWHQVYLDSELESALQSEIIEIRSTHHERPSDPEEGSATEFAAPLGEQFRVLVKRTTLHFWRSPN
jgi:hypothetical protein